MATLRHRHTDRKHVLETDCLVGRHESCNIKLEESFVSARHATFRWTGGGWDLKDLDSNNGTYVAGARIMQPCQVKAGTMIAFGRKDNEWELVSDSAPPVMLRPLDGTSPLIAEDGIFVLPSAEDVQATILPLGGGLWKLERVEGDPQTLENGSIFEVGGRKWRFTCPDPFKPTERFGDEHKMHQLEITLLHNKSEEYVKVSAQYAGKVIEIGSHACHYLLLFLARARNSDAAAGETELSAGWRYIDELAVDLAMLENRINVEVFRNRQLAVRAGIPDAMNIIERRARVGQLRIGTGHLVIRET